MESFVEITSELIKRVKELVMKNKRMASIATAIVVMFIMVTCVTTKVDNLINRVDDMEMRIAALEVNYADLSSNIAKLSVPIMKESIIYIIPKENFDKTVISLDDVYAKAKNELLKNKNIPEAMTVYLNAVKQSEEKGIPIHVIYTLLKTESSFKYTAKNPIDQKYGRGIMQVSDLVLSEYNNNNNTSYNTYDLEHNISINMEIGCWYYKRLYDHYNKGNNTMTWDDMYVAYNVGYTDFMKNKKSYYNGWDPTRKQKYTALTNWKENFDYYKKLFYS